MKGPLCPAAAPRCAATAGPNAVIYNEAAIYSPVLLTVFCQLAQRSICGILVGPIVHGIISQDCKQGSAFQVGLTTT